MITNLRMELFEALLFRLDDVEDKEEDINSVLVLVAPIIYS